VRTSFLPGLALWSLFPRPQSHGPTFWTVFYGKRLVNALTGEVTSWYATCTLTRLASHYRSDDVSAVEY
jgi:hypothetical protein